MKLTNKIAVSLLAVIGIAIYGASIGYDFIEIDDGGQVLVNPYLNSLSWDNLKGIFTSATVGMYQPLTTFVFAVLSAVFGRESAVPFHLLSLGLGAAMWRWRANKLLVFGGVFFLGNIILHTAGVTTFLGPFPDRYGYLSLIGF